MKILLIGILLFAFGVGCNLNNKGPSKEFPDQTTIDKKSINEIMSFINMTVDKFTKDTTYYLDLEYNQTHQNASLIFSKTSAMLALEPRMYISDYIKLSIVSDHKEAITIDGNAFDQVVGVYLSDLKEYLKDSGLAVRLHYNNKTEDFYFTDEQIKKIYLFYRFENLKIEGMPNRL